MNPHLNYSTVFLEVDFIRKVRLKYLILDLQLLQIYLLRQSLGLENRSKYTDSLWMMILYLNVLIPHFISLCAILENLSFELDNSLLNLLDW
jgi:hypothetical protein